ncbi:uncharacterized protein LOC142317476 [Lycorma delicatula]|uniref:uncharacterized protein LOC142317476 n=1 Tax=Lycorma delicatula TaxID=130591 RepID=UPI003F5129E3
MENRFCWTTDWTNKVSLRDRSLVVLAEPSKTTRILIVRLEGLNTGWWDYLAICPVPHGPSVPVPSVPEKLEDILNNSETELQDDCNDNDDVDFISSSSELQLFSQHELNDLVRDLSLPKNSAELLGSRLKKNLLVSDTSFSWYRFREKSLLPVLGVDGGKHLKRSFSGLYTGPYFDPNASSNVTTQLGAHAYLPCKVKQLGNKSQVSWIRRRDAHILTVDRYTFIADERFQSFLVEASDTWTLQIKYVQARDAGEYECQINAEPKISHVVTLHVVVPKIEIIGESDMYVKAGSQVNLKCVVTQSLESPGYIFWYHNKERMLENEHERKAIHTESISSDTTVSTFIIYEAHKEDSGNYTCHPTNLGSANVVLHVLNGEHPAAMRKNGACGFPGGWWGPLSLGLILRHSISHQKASGSTLLAAIEFLTSLTAVFI